MGKKSRVVIGISGASGAVIARQIVTKLAMMGGIEIHLVVTDSARLTLHQEIGSHALEELRSMSDVFHENEDIGASISSGSYPVNGMIVAPCSMRTLAAIATGNTQGLVARAADVQLKERRKLVLLVRETPLHLGHLRNMVTVTELGAIVMPPVPAFYRKPTSVDEIVSHLASRAIDTLRLPIAELADPWVGLERS